MASSSQDIQVLTNASHWLCGAINPTISPATSLPAKLPLGRRPTIKCAPTKPFGRGKAVKAGTDAQVTHLVSAILEEAAQTAAVKSSQRRVEAVVRC